MVNKVPRADSGFIVHPFETSDGKYGASFGNHNKTSRSFKTLKSAKAYLKRNKIRNALYDAPRGTRFLKLSKIRKGRKR